jgi:AAA-like domain
MALDDPCQPPGKPYDPAWYVHREEQEALALQHLLEGAPIVIIASLQMGKSTFIHHVVEQGATQLSRRHACEVTSVWVDMRAIESREDMEGDEFLNHLAWEIVAAAGKWSNLISLTHGHGPWTMRLDNFIQGILKDEEPDVMRGKFIVLIVHRMNALKSKNLRRGLYAQLRKWAYAPTGPLQRLRIILSTNKSPGVEDEYENASPSNGLLITLDELTVRQSMAMTKRYGFSWDRDGLAKIAHHIGGHPMMLRSAVYHAKFHEYDLDGAVARAQQADESVYSGHLKRMYDSIRSRKGLFVTLDKFLRSHHGPMNLDHLRALTECGLLRHDAVEKRYKFRYRIYETYLRKRRPALK